MSYIDRANLGMRTTKLLYNKIYNYGRQCKDCRITGDFRTHRHSAISPIYLLHFSWFLWYFPVQSLHCASHSHDAVEVPSNYLNKDSRTSLYMGGLVIAWESAMIGMEFIKNCGVLVATRVMYLLSWAWYCRLDH